MEVHFALWFIYTARIPTRFRSPNPMATLYCTEAVPIAWTRTRILIWITVPIFGMDIWTRIGIRVRVQQCKLTITCRIDISFTAHRQSVGKVMFLPLSVCSQGVGIPSLDRDPPSQRPPGQRPPCWHLVVATAAVVTHPAGMHSCFANA